MSSVYTVMIVDDNAEDRFLLTRFLQKTDLSLIVLEVSSGEEGINLLTSPIHILETRYPGISAPVTLFLDINMPVMDGWEFVEELERRRHDIKLKPTVVLMYSTSEDERDIAKATEYETVASYIVKGDSTSETLKQAILANHASVRK